ncbi:MAG: hypothetical protein LAQ69_05460 [Acidobacteriia bacterium]|nr:hypothetical protein [Terriglobia bacterium]
MSIYRFTTRHLFLLATGVVLSAGFAQSGDPSYLSRLPSGDRWIAHLTGDLLPFWTVPDDGTQTSADTELAAVSPGIFQLTAGSLAAANVVRVKADLTQAIEGVYQLGPANEVRARPIDLGPAAEQVYLSLHGTGIQKAKAVAVTVGGQDVPVWYWGSHASLTGVDQTNVGPLPRSLGGRGRVNLILTADGQTANPVQLVIQ